MQKVRNACAAAASVSLNDPYNGEGVLTNLAHTITLAETSYLQNLAWREKKDWNGVIFTALRRIWGQLDILLPAQMRPTTVGYTQEINPLGEGRSTDIFPLGLLAGPPIFAVSASGDNDRRNIIRTLTTSPFRTYGIGTQSTAGNDVHWAGGNCPETQNWLALIPNLMHPSFGDCRKFFISCTFQVNDVWRMREASDLFESVMPFCANCRALADNLGWYGLHIKDGSQYPSERDLREWVRERSLWELHKGVAG